MTQHDLPRDRLAPGREADGETLVLRAVRSFGRHRPGREGAGPAGAVPRLRAVPGAKPGVRRSATIDRAGLAAQGLVDPGGRSSRLAEELRVVKRPLLAHAFAPGAPPNGRIIVVTSAMPGEGKTFLAVNLALSLSLERDANVLLVDGDLALAEAAERLGIARTPGLSDLLADPPVDPGDVLVSTDVERLAFVPPGTSMAGMPELLGSRRMAAIVETVLAADPRRLIVIDAPPLLCSSDALALASLAGQAVFLVQAGATSRAAVDEALRLLAGHSRPWLLLSRTVNGRRYAPYGSEAAEGGVRAWLGRVLRRRRPAVPAVALTAGLTLAAAPSALARWTIVPDVTVGSAYTDNVGLRPRGQAKGDLVLELGPGVSVASRSGRLQLDAEYAAQELTFASEPGRSELRQRGQAAGRAELVDHLAYVDLVGDIGEAFADSRGATPSTPFNRTANRETRYAGGVSPFLRERLGDWGDAELRYRAFGIGYDSGDSASAAGQGVEAVLARRTTSGPLAWQARIAFDRTSAEATDGERAFATRSALAAVDARYRVAPGWAALLGLGSASLHDESLDRADRNGPYWSLGLAADPSRPVRLLARFGSLYGGWEAEDELVWHPRPTLSVTARYRQGLDSPLGFLRERLETAPTRVSAAAEEPGDARPDDKLAESAPGLLASGSQATFRQRRAELSVRGERGRYGGSLAAFIEDRKVDRGTDGGLATGFEASAVRRLTRRADLAVHAGWARVQQQDGGRSDDVRLTLSWGYRVMSGTRVELGYDLYRQMADAGADDLAANTVFARLVKSF